MSKVTMLVLAGALVLGPTAGAFASALGYDVEVHPATVDFPDGNGESRPDGTAEIRLDHTRAAIP